MSNRRKGGTKEVDLDEMVISGPQGAYEALQLYRSRAIRYKSKNDINSAFSTLVQGAKCLFTNSYENAGAELALLLIDFLVEVGGNLTDSQVAQVLDVDSCFPSSSSHRVEYLKAAIKWSAKAGFYELGEPKLHLALGQCLWPTDQSTSLYHLTAGEAPEQINNLIQSKYKSKDDQIPKERALITAVLLFLSIENLRDANALLSYYKTSCIDKDSEFIEESELERFCRYLLLIFIINMSKRRSTTLQITC
jgi:hypothetical protein